MANSNQITTVLKLAVDNDASGPLEKAAASSKKFQGNTERLIKTLELEKIALEKGKNEMLLHKAAMEGATLDQLASIKSLQNKIKALNAAEQTEEGYTDAVRRSTAAQRASNQAMTAGQRSARQLRGMAGQLGHQFQDIAVQMSMGTNAMLVFGQQGSQIASVLGPSGAMFGAVIAIGAAMSVFFDETKKAKGALDDIGDSARAAAKETENLSNATRAYLAVELAKEIREQEAALKALSSQEGDRETQLRRHTSAQEAINLQLQSGIGLAYGGAEAIAALNMFHVKSADDLRDLNEANDQQAGSVEQVNKKLSELRKQRQALLNQENPFFEMADSTKRSADDISRDLDRIRESLMTQDEQAYKKYIDDLQTVAQATHLSMKEREELSLQIMNKYRREQEAQRMAAADKENQFAAKQRLAKVKQLSAENDELLKQAISDQKEKDRALESLKKDAEAVNIGSMDEIERARYEEQEKLAILREAEEAGVQLSRSYAEIRKGIAEETAEAIMEARLKEASLPELERVQIEGAKARADFEKKTARDKTKFVLDELNTELGGLSKYNKKIFALQKGVQIGQAIMNTHTAATRALAQYGMPLGPIFAGLAIANGMAQVAQIKAQSFEGGGFTGSGSRSGGLDGKGGFMAMVHPNESIIDHTKGQAGGITIINNVDATGGGSDVDQKIQIAMEVTSQQTVMQVQDLLRRQRLV